MQSNSRATAGVSAQDRFRRVLRGRKIAIVMEQDNVKDGRIVAEWLLKVFREMAVEHDGRTIRVTASIGAAQVDPQEALTAWTGARIARSTPRKIKGVIGRSWTGSEERAEA